MSFSPLLNAGPSSWSPVQNENPLTISIRPTIESLRDRARNGEGCWQLISNLVNDDGSIMISKHAESVRINVPRDLTSDITAMMSLYDMQPTDFQSAGFLAGFVNLSTKLNSLTELINTGKSNDIIGILEDMVAEAEVDKEMHSESELRGLNSALKGIKMLLKKLG